MHLDDSDPVAPDFDLITGVAAFSKGALKAVPQWVTSSFVSSVAESPITVSELLGKGLVSIAQSAEYVANYFEGIWADPDARENLYYRVSQDIADATGKSIDEVRPQVAASIQAWAQPFFDAWERSDYETALPMLGQLTTNVGLEIATCYAKLPEAARFVELAEQVKETGLAKRLSEGLKALKALRWWRCSQSSSTNLCNTRTSRARWLPS